MLARSEQATTLRPLDARSLILLLLCPKIKPYNWQIDVAEALALGLDATVVAGTGSGKTLPCAMPLLLEGNRDKICLVISPLNELEADHVRQRRIHSGQRISLSCFSILRLVFYREAQDTCRSCEP